MIYGIAGCHLKCVRARAPLFHHVKPTSFPMLLFVGVSFSTSVHSPHTHTHTHPKPRWCIRYVSALPFRIMYVFPSPVCRIIIVCTRRYPLLEDCARCSPNSYTYLYCLNWLLFFPILGQPIYLTCSRNFVFFLCMRVCVQCGCICHFSPSPIWNIVTVLWLLFYYCIMPVGLLAITAFLPRVDAPLQIGKISIYWRTRMTSVRRTAGLRVYVLSCPFFPLPFVCIHMRTRRIGSDLTNNSSNNKPFLRVTHVISLRLFLRNVCPVHQPLLSIIIIIIVVSMPYNR